MRTLRFKKLTLTLISLFCSLELIGFAEAAPKKKTSKETSQVEDSWGTPVIDARGVDNNQTDKSKEWYRGDFDGLDDD
jgi:hypothetical protein